MIRGLFAVAVSTVLFLSCSKQTPQEKKPEQEKAKQPARLVHMSIEAQRHVGLQSAPTRFENLSEYLQVTGTVQPMDSRTAHVRLLSKGRARQILVRVGDRVKSGQALAEFDNIEAGEILAQLNGARAELQRLKIQRATAENQAERNRKLSELGAIPQKEYEISIADERTAAESIKMQESVITGLTSRLRRFGVVDETDVRNPSTVISAPFSGVITKAEIAPGEVVDADKELFSVTDLSRVWVQAEVYEKDLGRIRVGRIAFVKVDTYPGHQFQGTVTYIGDILDPQTRTARVRCEVDNSDIRLKLDMFATVALPTTFSKRALVVRASALQQVDGKNVVFIKKSDSNFEVRPVSAGNTVRGLVDIIAGLKEGEPVVVQGSFHLKSIALGGQLEEE